MWKTATPELFRERFKRRLDIQLLSQVLPQSQEGPAQELFSYLKHGHYLFWDRRYLPVLESNLWLQKKSMQKIVLN